MMFWIALGYVMLFYQFMGYKSYLISYFTNTRIVYFLLITKAILPFWLKMYAWKWRFNQQQACNMFTMNILLIYFCVLNINLFSERQYLISKFESIFVSFKVIICCKESYLMQVYRKTEVNEIWQVRICSKI